MTVSSIIDQHTETVLRRYPREAGHVVEAIKEGVSTHLNEVAERLVEGGTRLGARREQVEALLVEAGLVEPTPEPEPEPVADEADEDSALGKGRKSQRIAALEAEVESLRAFARRHGFTG